MALLSDVVPAFDPEEACQGAIEAGFVVHRAHPLNCEVPIRALIGGGGVTPSAHFFVRNHFQMPMIDASTWRLSVGGLVNRPLSLSLRDLHKMRSQTMIVTLECAGNGRSRFYPPIDGVEWDLGAVSTAEWTGVPLVDVLDRAGIKAKAHEVVFRGADAGTVDGRTDPIHFARSLKLDDARESQALLAYAVNSDPIPPQQGYPLRVIVPGWYGMTSVKWLAAIDVIPGPFTGYFQTDAYFYEWNRNGKAVREPVTLQKVRSLITEPAANQQVERSELAVRGVAWSGAAPVARVEVSVGGAPWQEADLVGGWNGRSWQAWEVMTRIDRPGATPIRTRATDLAGRTQPEEPDWNRFGYGNNAIHEVRVHAR
jgi:DMSO/TMAO reductase YedYZ molybdopterin-dependent catalytic subunit